MQYLEKNQKMSTINIADLQPTYPEVVTKSQKIIEVSESEAKKTYGGRYKTTIISTGDWVVTICQDGTINHGSGPYCPGL